MKLFDFIQNAFGKNKTTKKQIEVDVRKGRYSKTETPVDREVELAKIEKEVELERIELAKKEVELKSKKFDFMTKLVDANLNAEQMMNIGSIMDQTTRSITASQFQPSLAIRASSVRASTRQPHSTKTYQNHQTSPMKIVEGTFLKKANSIFTLN